jgi:hypothetical protein
MEEFESTKGSKYVLGKVDILTKLLFNISTESVIQSIVIVIEIPNDVFVKSS